MSSVSNQIAYLTGGEKPTAECMNRLFMTLDRKLGKMLFGKSPILAQTANFPAFLLGKTFFFTGGHAVAYSQSVPGAILMPGNTPPVVRDYVHAQLTSAVAAITLSAVTWDEVNKIAKVPRFPAVATVGNPSAGTYQYTTAYPTDPGIPCDLETTDTAYQVGFLENSLQCHSLMHQGASDDAPVPYYIAEAGAKAPEKRYDWAVAELILEGQTSLTIPAAWDKYKFFRIHNLNPAVATVTFQMDATAKPGTFVVTVPAFGCQTVRRASVASGYATNGNYFWWALEGDPRLFWFQPCGYGPVDQNTNRWTWAWDGRVADTQQNNNLANPYVLLEWIAYFTRDVDDFPGQNNYGIAPCTIHAGFIQDLTVQQSEYQHYTSLYGNPSNPATCLGDLIHHKGTVYAIKSSKTHNDAVSGKPWLTIIKGAFNGYATFVADMAALGVTVTTNSNGDYELSNADYTHYDVTLIPIGTNFLKQGETLPSYVTLSSSPDRTSGHYTLESAVLESDPTNSESALANTSLVQLVFPPAFTSTADTRQWIDPYTMTTPVTVTGPNLTKLTTVPRSGTPAALHGIHNVTVAQLLTLNLWGDPAHNPQSGGGHYTITGAQLSFDPQGLLLTYNEQYDGTQPGTMYSTYYQNWALGYATSVFPKQIRFRHHGFGYLSDMLGAATVGYFSARCQLYQDGGGNYQNDIFNATTPGNDFTFAKTNCTKVGVQVQTHVSKNAGSVFKWGGGRFWTTKYAGHHLISVWQGLQKPMFNVASVATNADGSQTFTLDTGATMTVPAGWTDPRMSTVFSTGGFQIITTESASPNLCMVLLPELYNMIALAINQLTRGVPLNYRALRFLFSGHVFAFDPAAPIGMGMGYIGENPALTGYSSFVNSPLPIPATTFTTFDQDSVFDQFCAAQGIPVYTSADFPQQDLFTKQTTPLVMVDTVNVSVVSSTFDWGTGATTSGGGIDGPNANWSAVLSVLGDTELLSSKSLAQGMATGSNCLGTFNPNQIRTVSSSRPGLPDEQTYWPVFPDGAQPWQYMVCSETMTQDTATAMGVTLPNLTKGDIVLADGSIHWVFGQAQGTTNGRNSYFVSEAMLPAGGTVNLISGYQYFRWVKLADAEKFLLQFGLAFSFEEVAIPLTLDYFEDACKLTNTNCCKNLAGSYAIHTSGPVGSNPLSAFNGLTAQAGRVITLGGNDGSGVYQPWGTWLGFYVDTHTDGALSWALKAQWKMRNPGAYGPATYYAPLPVTNINARVTASQLFRVVQFSASLGMDVYYTSSARYNPPPNYPFWQGVLFGEWGDPRPVAPNISAGLDGGGCCNVNAGQQPTAGNVSFICSVFTVPSGDAGYGPNAAFGRVQGYQGDGIQDQWDAYAVHTYGAPRMFNVQLIGQNSWLRTVDGWNTPDAMFKCNGYSNIAQGGLGSLPFTTLAAPANVTLSAPQFTSSTPNGGVETNMVLTAPAQQRFTALFNLARLAIDLSTIYVADANGQNIANEQNIADGDNIAD